MCSTYSSRSMAVTTERIVIARSSLSCRRRVAVGAAQVDGDVEVEQGAQVPPLVGDLRDQHVHRVPRASGSSVSGTVGDHHVAPRLRSGRRRRTSPPGSTRSWRWASPSAKARSMSPSRDAVPIRSSAAVSSPWIRHELEQAEGTDDLDRADREPGPLGTASLAKASIRSRARASPQLRSRVRAVPGAPVLHGVSTSPPVWIVGAEGRPRRNYSSGHGRRVRRTAV